MRRKLLIAVPLLFLVTLAAWMLRPRRETLMPHKRGPKIDLMAGLDLVAL